MSDLIPVMLGTKGMADGELIVLGPKMEIVIGRSRTCEISFQRFRKFTSLSTAEQKIRDSYNSAVSRRHLRLQTNGPLVRLENLSAAGSFCDDQRFDGVLEIDLAKGPVVLRLGQAIETFQLTLFDQARLDEFLAHTQPMLIQAQPALQPGVPDPVEDPTPLSNPVIRPDGPTSIYL